MNFRGPKHSVHRHYHYKTVLWEVNNIVTFAILKDHPGRHVKYHKRRLPSTTGSDCLCWQVDQPPLCSSLTTLSIHTYLHAGNSHWMMSFLRKSESDCIDFCVFGIVWQRICTKNVLMSVNPHYLMPLPLVSIPLGVHSSFHIALSRTLYCILTWS